MKPSGRVKSMGYGGRRPGFKSWLYYWLVVESWASYLVIWSLNFLTCNMVVTSTLESVEVKQDNVYKVLISTLSCRSVQFSCSVVSDSATPWTAARQASLSITKLLESTQTHALSNPCPLCRWCHPTISSSVVPFSTCPQSFPASGSFQMSLLFASGNQSIGVSTSTSVLTMNTQDWPALGWISLQSKELSSLLQHLSSKASILQCSAFFIVQLSHPHMTTGKTTALIKAKVTDGPLWTK